MPESTQSKVIQHMEDILARHPEGVRSKTLTTEIHQKMPDALIGTIRATLSTITGANPDKFYKISEPGATYYFLHTAQNENIEVTTPIPQDTSESSSSSPDTDTNNGTSTGRQFPEKDYYEPFAKYLQSGDDNLNVCTSAIPLGRNVFGDQWTTPDVIGLFKPRPNDVIDFSTEVISVEIKIDGAQMMHGFGQACAYRLFSHRIYLVIPKMAKVPRIEELCRVLGLGLVYLDTEAAEEQGEITNSMFDAQLLAQKHEPNMFYVNEYMRKIGHLL